jgi:thioesterase domain-containing protein
MSPSFPVIILPGAGGGAPNLDVFRADVKDQTRFEVISYPEWKGHVASGFSADAFIADLAARIATRVPRGPIRIVGLSIGGHFGYAAALRLQAMGREIAGFCAIDSFMISSSAPNPGWMGRALAQGLDLMAQRRFRDLALFLRSKFWRSLIRLAGNKLPSLLQQFRTSLPSLVASDRVLENELSMRLLIRETAPWIASLDRDPIALQAPAVLLRTNRTAGDDDAWRRRCPNIGIAEIPGQHHSLFEAENVGALHDAFVAATRVWH